MATGRSDWTRRPLPEVFAPTKLTIKEGETPAPLEIRALPSVVIEGHWVDSKGQPKGGLEQLASSARSTARSGSPRPTPTPRAGSR